MKRIVLMALVLCLCLSCLAGCGGSGSETTEAPATQAPAATESGSDATEAPAAEETEAPEDASLYPLEEAVTLSVLGPIYAPRSAGVIETWDEAPFYAAASEATNIYLEFSCVSTEAYNNQFNIVVASGDMPDMFWQGLRQYSGGADAAIDEGIFVNLADYLDYAPDYVSALETYGYTSNVTTDSGNMAAFYAIGKNESRPLMGFVIRQDWLDELSLEAPVTYDDYYNVLTAFKTEYNIPEPITMGYMGAVCGDWL